MKAEVSLKNFVQKTWGYTKGGEKIRNIEHIKNESKGIGIGTY